MKVTQRECMHNCTWEKTSFINTTNYEHWIRLAFHCECRSVSFVMSRNENEMNEMREWVLFYEFNLVANSGKKVTTSCHNVNTNRPHWIYGIALSMLSMTKQTVDRDKDIKNLKPKHFFMPLLLSHTLALIVWCILLSTFCAALRLFLHFTCKVRAFFMTTSLSFDTNFLYAFITHRDTKKTAWKGVKCITGKKSCWQRNPRFFV